MFKNVIERCCCSSMICLQSNCSTEWLDSVDQSQLLWSCHFIIGSAIVMHVFQSTRVCLNQIIVAIHSIVSCPRDCNRIEWIIMWRWECNTIGFFSCVSWCWIVHGLSFEKQPTRWVNAETTQWSEISNWFRTYWGMGLRSHSVTIGQKPKLIWSFEPWFISYMLSQWMLMLAVVQITSLIQ